MGDKMNKKIILLSLVLLSTIFIASCAKKGDKEVVKSKSETIQNIKKNFDGKVIQLDVIDLETDKEFGNEILQKDMNFVIIWQPTCKPCKVEIPVIEQIYKDYENIDFIGIGVAETKEELKNSLSEWNINFKNYKATDKFIESISDITNSTPTLFVLDRNGKEIVPTEIGYSFTSEQKEEAIKDMKDKIEAYEN